MTKKILKAAIDFGPEKDGQTFIRQQLFEKQKLTAAKEASLKNFMLNSGYIDRAMSITTKGILLANRPNKTLSFWLKVAIMPFAISLITIYFTIKYK